MKDISLENFDAESFAERIKTNWSAVTYRLSDALIQSDKLLADGELGTYDHRKLIHEIERQREDSQRMSIDQILHYFMVKSYLAVLSDRPSDIERTERAIASNLAIAEATKSVATSIDELKEVIKEIRDGKHSG
jgi:hypothetical protein